METVREIVFYKQYFEDFFNTLNDRVKVKFDEVLFMVTIFERVPKKFLKALKVLKGFLKLGWSMKGISIGYFVVLIGAI